MRVSVILPVVINHEWQRLMTQFAIDIMASSTSKDFELLIVETGTRHFDSFIPIDDSPIEKNVRYLHFDKRNPASYTKDFNAAIDIAKGDIIIQIANDIFVMPGWLEAILDCFKIKNCGAATLSSIEANHPKTNIIRESWCFPVLMAWRKGFRFDENFRNNCSDTDLIMQIYDAGYKMYRNLNVQFYHLIKATFRESGTMEDGKVAIERFKKKWEGNPSFVFQALSQGMNI